MAITKEDLVDFQRYADEKLNQGEMNSIAELAIEWESQRVHDYSIANLQKSQREDEQGNSIGVDQAFSEIRDNLGRS